VPNKLCDYFRKSVKNEIEFERLACKGQVLLSGFSNPIGHIDGFYGKYPSVRIKKSTLWHLELCSYN